MEFGKFYEFKKRASAGTGDEWTRGKVVRMYAHNLLIIVVLFGIFAPCFSLWCYRCVGTHPGCGENDFNYRWHWSWFCPDVNDRCVKLIERKGADVMVTRDCLSTLKVHRHDVPADTYEGCKTASTDVRLAHYTFHNIKEDDIKRTYYDNTTWCFCDFDERCNSASYLMPSLITFITAILFLFKL